MYTYDTVSQAINGLKKRGFTEDFNLEENCIICHVGKFGHSEFEITEVYRFEGESNPDDEAIVYAIESKGGVKGVLVNSYGYQSEAVSDEIAKKLQIHTH